MEDIEKEVIESKPKYEYWMNIFKKKRKEYKECVQYDIDRKQNIIDKDETYDNMNSKYNCNDWCHYFNESYRLGCKYDPQRIQYKNLLNGVNALEIKIFSFLKIGDIFWREDFLYKIINKTHSFTYYKKIAPEYFELYGLDRFHNYFDIQNYTLEDKIYKKKEYKKGVVKISKSGIY
jgi:hypothetical protein